MKKKWLLWLALLILWTSWMVLNVDILNQKSSISPLETRNPLPEPSHSDSHTYIPASLSLIASSPRWKPPYGNHNASINASGGFKFPNSSIPIISILIKKKSFFDWPPSQKRSYHLVLKTKP